MGKTRIFALVSVFLVQVIYGLTFTFANDVIDDGHIKPFGFILLRVLGATGLFWLLSLFTPREKVDKKDYVKFFVASIFGLALNMLTFFKGLEHTTPIHASVIMTVTPIVVLVLSALFLKERITHLKLIGIVLGFSGAVILSVYGKSTQIGDNVLFGNLLVFINAVSYSIYLVLIKKLTAKYHPFTFIKWLFLFGLILITPFGFNELSQVHWDGFHNYIWFSVLFIIIASTFGTYLLNPLALRHLKASTVSTFLYLQPVVAVIFALIMKSDNFGVIKAIASVLIFSGVYLVTKKPKLQV